MRASYNYTPSKMPETIQDSITRLIRYQRASADATKLFRSWKHNSDILPRVQGQLETLMIAYGKFQPIVYDTQGIHDDGSDIVLRYRPEDTERDFELIAFQVKSFTDLEKKTYMQELKAQRDDSFRKVFRLRYYFVLLCTDGKKHQERVRNVMAEFRSADKTEIIEPGFALTFLTHPSTRVEALVKRAMESGDLVFRLALESLELPSPSARALTIFMVVRSVLTGLLRFNVDEFSQDPTLRNVYDELRDHQTYLLDQSRQYALEQTTSHDDNPDEDEAWEEDEEEEPIQLDYFEGQLAKDLEIMDSDIVDLDPASPNVLLRTGQVRALSAVVTDALARYDYSEPQLMAYMFSLMGVRD